VKVLSSFFVLLKIVCSHMCKPLAPRSMRYVNCSFMLFFAGATPFMASAQSGDISTVKYLLDHGANLMKADAKGRTVLHHAVSVGLCHHGFFFCIYVEVLSTKSVGAIFM